MAAYAYANNPSVSLSIYGQVFLTPGHLAIAMDYAQGGDLFNVKYHLLSLKILFNKLCFQTLCQECH